MNRLQTRHSRPTYMELLAQLTELRHYERCCYEGSGVELIDEAVIGRRDGYIVAIRLKEEVRPRKEGGLGALGEVEGEGSIRIFVRFSPPTNPEALKSFVEDPEALKSFIEDSGVEFHGEKLRLIKIGNSVSDFTRFYEKGSQGDKVEDEVKVKPPPDHLEWIWCYPFPFKPAPKRVAALLNVLLDALKTIISPLKEQCETCGQSSVFELTLRNDIPGYYCSPCQQKQINRLNREVLDYENQPVNLSKGFVYGLVAAVLAGIGGAYLGLFITPKWLGIAALLGTGLLTYPVFIAAEMGAGRIDNRVAVMILWMTALEVVITNAGYYVFVAQRSTGLPFGGALIRSGLDVFLQKPFGHTAVFVGMLLLSLYVVVRVGLRHAGPRPKVFFKPLVQNDITKTDSNRNG